jgi:DNA-binding NarL/FixJ family response regulator
VTVRAVVADDQELVRAGLRRILSPRRGVEIVGEATDGRTAVELVQSLAPDVVVMDVRMPVLDGPGATAQLRRLGVPVPVLVLTTYDDEAVLAEALRAGASGFLLKDSAAEDLLRAVRTVASGGSWLDPAVTRVVLDTYRSAAATTPTTAPPPPDLLTPREHEVLELMARGATNAELAERLFLSEATVKTHIGRIFSKLGVRDRAGAIVWAYDTGVVRPRS